MKRALFRVILRKIYVLIHIKIYIYDLRQALDSRTPGKENFVNDF